MKTYHFEWDIDTGTLTKVGESPAPRISPDRTCGGCGTGKVPVLNETTGAVRCDHCGMYWMGKLATAEQWLNSKEGEK